MQQRQHRRNTRQSSPTRQRARQGHKSSPIEALPNTTVRKKGNVIFMFHKSRRKIPWRVIIALVCVFVGAIGSAYSYAQIHNMQQEISESERDLRNITTANRNLEAQITRSYTREEIEHHALTRLGLGPPDPSQIIYFHVPHHSGLLTSTYASPIPIVETGFWQSIVDFFRGIFNRLQ
ncbi:MAG: septum formation initiator family protein [Defluviitaleaceae bacterium]|nr:septum formation initiator family protein [Defluviitaleaceae bacterium]